MFLIFSGLILQGCTSIKKNQTSIKPSDAGSVSAKVIKANRTISAAEDLPTPHIALKYVSIQLVKNMLDLKTRLKRDLSAEELIALNIKEVFTQVIDLQVKITESENKLWDWITIY